ncbi:MAG: RNA polymerase sigma factor [Candidatus Sumerlaeaceae bacterium]
MDDKEIIAGLQHGSPEAADALLDRYAQPLLRYFAAHLPDPAQAEDMAQEVFLRFIGTLAAPAAPGQTAQVRSIYSLLFTIARHLAIDVGKAAKRKPPAVSLESELEDVEAGAMGPVLIRLSGASPDPRSVAAANQEHQRLQQALRKLPLDLREILVLRHLKELGARDIAQILGIPEGTVWSRLNRGLSELRREYSALTDNPLRSTEMRSAQ